MTVPQDWMTGGILFWPIQVIVFPFGSFVERGGGVLGWGWGQWTAFTWHKLLSSYAADDLLGFNGWGCMVFYINILFHTYNLIQILLFCIYPYQCSHLYAATFVTNTTYCNTFWTNLYLIWFSFVTNKNLLWVNQQRSPSFVRLFITGIFFCWVTKLTLWFYLINAGHFRWKMQGKMRLRK